MVEKRNIYILLTHSGSVFSRAIGIYTRDPYTHVSIAFDRDLNELYSFGRLKPWNPVFGGFVKEDIIEGTFGRFPNTRCALYSLEVDDFQYQKLKKEIYRFKREADRYGYNFLGLLTAMFHQPLTRKYSYFCSQFVSEVLLNSGINIVNKPPGLTSPMDIKECQDLEFIYEGYLSTYRMETGMNYARA